ncbi:protein-tyrosine phosphatase-like protein [Kalaharituber pfeilii]|nr:protein-tyrosine phosphatase-like protein [Kalaharituber pfeilii]
MASHLWRSGSYADARSASSQYDHAIVNHRSPRSSRRRKGGLPPFLQLDRTEIRQKWRMLDAQQRERFEESKTGSEQWAVDRSMEAIARNRYSNIFPWSENRIRLNVPENKCDYINASPIVLDHGRQGMKRYIATQGPKRGQYNHLWRMVWQETGSVAVIIMLTRTLEQGQHKCFQYYPLKLEDSPWDIDGDEEFGDGFRATLTLLEKTKVPAAGCTVRKMSMEVAGEKKIVWHLLFKGWPDFGVPAAENKAALVEMIRIANLKNTEGPENPLIVHCSAGVGRSGTYITLDYLLREVEIGSIKSDETEDPVFDTVNMLREQRMYMVQSEAQLHFIYEVLKEKFVRHRKSVSPPAGPPSRRESRTLTLQAMMQDGTDK